MEHARPAPWYTRDSQGLAASTRTLKAPRLATRVSVRGMADGDKSLHSSDIAFKPTVGGWGFNSSFANGYDRIFAESKAKAELQVAKSDAAPAPKVSSVMLSNQIKALEEALSCGALTQEQYSQALDGVRHRAK